MKCMHMISRDGGHSDSELLRGGGRGRRPFGKFPKIHPIWYRDLSLKKVLQRGTSSIYLAKVWRYHLSLDLITSKEG